MEGPANVYICEDCIKLSTEILEHAGHPVGGGDTDFDTIPRPSELKRLLDDYVIGQDDVKAALSVAVYNHFKRLKVT